MVWLQVFIEKKDTHTGYTFTAKFENDKQEVSGSTYTKRLVHVSLNTPGSLVDRKLLVEGIYDPATMTASAQLETPWKKFDWSGESPGAEILLGSNSSLQLFIIYVSRHLILSKYNEIGVTMTKYNNCELLLIAHCL